MNEVTCTRRLSFDAGHRLVGHEGKCAHYHGHRYDAEFVCANEHLDGVGRVVDFGEVKRVVGAWIDEHLDHAMILRRDDELMRASAFAGHPVFVMDVNPTAENLAALLLAEARRLLPGIHVVSVRLYETPNGWADAR